MQCQNLYKSSSKKTIQTICILIHMISFNFVLIIKKSDALHEHILHKIGVLFGLNSKTCSFYSYGIRNIGANSNAKISISSPDIKEQCFLVMLAGAHETQCFFFIYGINSSNNTVNHTNFLDTNVVLTGSLDDKTIYIQIGPWARGFICSYNSFTVAIK